MAGLQTLVLLAVIFCLALCCVSCHDTQNDLLDDYPNTLIESPELGELLERDKVRRIVDHLQMRRKKDPSCLISPGAGACNTKQAIEAVLLNRLAAELGRRKRQITSS